MTFCLLFFVFLQTLTEQFQKIIWIMKKTVYLALIAFTMLMAAASCGSKSESSSDSDSSDSKSEKSEKSKENPTDRLSAAIDDFVDFMQDNPAEASVDDLTEVLEILYPAIEAFIDSDPSKADCEMIQKKYNKFAKVSQKVFSKWDGPDLENFQKKFSKSLKKAGYSEEYDRKTTRQFTDLLDEKISGEKKAEDDEEVVETYEGYDDSGSESATISISYLYLTGSIGGANDGLFVYNYDTDDGDVSFTVNGVKNVRKLKLGSFDADSGRLVMKEYYANGTYVGDFDGTWRDGVYRGVFTNTKGGRVDFVLRSN